MRPKNSSCPAFTLVEMIVSCAILSLLGVMIVGILNQTTGVSRQTVTKLEATRTARDCLDMIGKDLSKAVLPYAASVDSLQLIANAPSLGIPSQYANPHFMFWQTPAISDEYGNIAVTGYYVLRDINLTKPADTRLQLRRLFVKPEDPDGTPSEYLIYASPSSWVTPGLLGQFAPSSVSLDFANAQKGWVADGVLAIWVRCLDPLGNPITTKADGTSFATYEFDSRKSYTYRNSANKLLYPAGKAGSGVIQASALPDSIEVGLVCCASQDMALIQQLPGYTTASPQNFYSEMAAFEQAAAGQNPRVKSIGSFSRTFRLYKQNLSH